MAEWGSARKQYSIRCNRWNSSATFIGVAKAAMPLRSTLELIGQWASVTLQFFCLGTFSARTFFEKFGTAIAT